MPLGTPAVRPAAPHPPKYAHRPCPLLLPCYSLLLSLAVVLLQDSVWLPLALRAEPIAKTLGSAKGLKLGSCSGQHRDHYSCRA